MARVRPATVAAVVAAAAAGAVAGAVGVAAVYRRRSGSQAPASHDRGLQTPAPQKAATEPVEGYEARWELRGQLAMDRCVGDPQVRSFAQALTCALNTVYPEAAPWTDPSVWSPWMVAAGAHAEAALEAAAGGDEGNPRAWQYAVWLNGKTAIDACRAQPGARGRFPRIVALCAAQRIYPGAAWDRPRAPWQTEMIQALVAMAGEA